MPEAYRLFAFSSIIEESQVGLSVISMTRLLNAERVHTVHLTQRARSDAPC